MKLRYNHHRAKGLGRPTKKDRREMDNLFPIDDDSEWDWDDWDILNTNSQTKTTHNILLPIRSKEKQLTLEDCYAIAKDPKNTPKKRYYRKKK